MNRLRIKLLSLALCLVFAGQVSAHDAVMNAISSLIDPAKLATLRGNRAANQRVLKCVYWLNDTRSRGLEPEAVIEEA